MVNHLPTLSILLPCHNEEKTLARQLDAILPQLLSSDEMILINDGSKDDTGIIINAVSRLPNVRALHCQPAHGVNEAYNLCARLALKDWLLGCSGNDRVQPGAMAAWREAANEWPEARLICGRVRAEVDEQWGQRPSRRFVPPDKVVDMWGRFHGQHTHGAAVFTRRDAFVPYGAGGYMADWWAAWKVGAEWGYGWIDEVISELGPPGYSGGHNTDWVYNQCVSEIKKDVNHLPGHLRRLAVKYQELTHFTDPREEIKLMWFERGMK